MMAVRRMAEDRVTYTTPEEVAELVVGYYENVIQHKPDEEKREFFLGAARSGLGADALFSAVDYAVSVIGFGRYERDYWPHVQEDARRIWREMHPEAKKPKREEKKPPQ